MSKCKWNEEHKLCMSVAIMQFISDRQTDFSDYIPSYFLAVNCTQLSNYLP